MMGIPKRKEESMPWNFVNMTWVILFILFIVVEAFSAGVVSIWFAFGALGALIVALLGGTMIWQVVVFIVISALMLMFTRPILKTWLNVRVTRTNVDAILGKSGVVTKSIFLNDYGEVKVDGQRWTAKTVGETPIELNEQIEVIAVEGVKLIVKKK